MKKLLLTIALASTSISTVLAEELLPQTIEVARLEGIPPDRPPKASATPDPAIIRLQILLDRSGSSPGVIDGIYGENVTKAIAGFEILRDLPVDGKLDPDMLSQLQDNQPVATTYEIAKEDVTALVPEIPSDFAKQAAMKHLGYTSVIERLSERFHMAPDLLKSMNPTTKFKEGETLNVAAIGNARAGTVKRIEAKKSTGQVIAFGEDGKPVAAYPATIGSDDNPSPTGAHKVKGVARMPSYTYNPKVNFQQGRNKKVLELPSGPNNPVGTVWIDLSEPTYGIHGTPEPSKIDKVGSHGCIRLTNWDVEELAAMVRPGVTVDIKD